MDRGSLRGCFARPPCRRGFLSRILVSCLSRIGSRHNDIFIYIIICMYVCMYVCNKVGSGQVRFGSVRFKGQGMTDTRWITYNLTSPAAGSCCWLSLFLMTSLPTCFTVGAELATVLEQVPHTVRHQPQSFDDELLDQAAELWLALCRGRQRISQMNSIASSRTPICRG